MPELPLAGCGIAITRPAEQAGALAAMVREAGGTPIGFPLLAIAPLEDYTAFEHLIANLAAYDWVIFISSNAVQQGMPRIASQYPAYPPRLRFAAIGPATAQELALHGVNQVLIPEGRFDSESLLARPEMQKMQHQRVLIVRGVGGRELLAEKLRERGAEVDFAECYRRVNPQRDAGKLHQLWQNGQLHALVVTSSEALRYLVQLGDLAAWLRNSPIFVNHARIGEAAREHGLNAVVAEASGDAAMLQCLIHHFQDRTTT